MPNSGNKKEWWEEYANESETGMLNIPEYNMDEFLAESRRRTLAEVREKITQYFLRASSTTDHVVTLKAILSALEGEEKE